MSLLKCFNRATALALATAVGLVSCLPENHLDDQVEAAIQAGTFENPSANVRPRFRYWLPDASVNLSRVALDIADAKMVGAGGVEVLGYYLYDSAQGNIVPTDWTTYGWGTPAWKTLFDTLIKAHKDNGLIMDFAMGPNQGQGVPAHEDDDGLMWDIRLFNQTVPVGGSFDGVLPGWGTGQLQAAVTGLVTSSIETSDPGPGLPTEPSSSREQNTLSTASLQDVTDQVGSDGSLSITFPSDSTGLHYTIFAVYLIQMHYRNEADPTTLVGPETVPQDFIHNGSWTVDHFSARGAKVMTDFWEKYLLIDGTKEALMEVANYGWEDSCEINPDVYWTRYLPEAFQKRRGYSINKFLPTLFHQNDLNSAATTWWITDEEDSGNSHIADYRTTLTEMYGDYLQALTEWANSYLNIQFSAQVSYNMAMDMQTNIAKVNGPECESLGFGHVIDAYRQYAGPANIAGKRIISSECGANFEDVYQQTLPDLLWDVRRSIAGGVNNFVFHGYPYSGNYGMTTWPQFTTFYYLFSEMHGRHQPAWDFYSDSIDYAARLQYIFQSGIPKRDLAFYQKFTAYQSVPRNYQPTDLEAAGYTYEYLNPENLDEPKAVIQHGILAPERQAFKALIVRANDSMTVPGVERISEIAHTGFPVIFSGGIPSYLASYNASGSAYINETLKSLTSLSNVHVVHYEGLAATISSLRIQPATIIQASNTWYTYWRTDGSTDYVFVYNDAFGSPLGSGTSQGTVEFQSTGTPYLFDAWTGAQTPISNYTQSNNSTTIYFELAGNQAVIVAFKNNECAAEHVVSASPGVISFTTRGSDVVANVGNTASTCVTSDGRSHSLAASSATPITLSNWTLVVEHWDPPSDLTDIETVAVKSNTTHSLPTLTSWQNIAGLQNVSGRGYYSASFNLNPDPQGGAIIDFGAVVHTIRLSINGHVLPPLDTTWARADITPYLVKGENKVEAVVATTLVNRLIPIWTSLRASGVGPLLGPPTSQDYGLLFDVVITPYKSTVVC